jgi:cell division septation protein DedD
MPRNEDGEFELVVGNKQLLSVVFILMVLFGVVFSMGYFVGRANTATDTPAQQAANQAAARPQPAGAESTPAAVADATPDASLAPGDARVTAPETTAPVASATPAATPPPPVETPKPAATPAPALAAAPQPGQTFLQVAAVRKPQADMLVDVLKEKGFRALTAPVAPGSQQYRTLVGPLRNAADLAKTKSQLEDAGFKPIVKRY